MGMEGGIKFSIMGDCGFPYNDNIAYLHLLFFFLSFLRWKLVASRALKVAHASKLNPRWNIR